MARVARKLAGGFLGAGAGWWAYDAQTGHKMRTMTHPFYHRAFLEGSVTRLRNLLLCADTPLRAVLLPMLSPAELARFDGRGEGPASSRSAPVYFALCGLVYDASSSDTFREAYAQWAGRDATLALARMSLDPEEGRTEVWEDVELSAEELETVRSWQAYFDEKYPVVGTLSSSSSAAAVAAPTTTGPMPPAPPSASTVAKMAAAAEPAIFCYGADWCGYTRMQINELQEALEAAEPALGGKAALRIIECDKVDNAVCAALRGYPFTVVHAQGGAPPDAKQLLQHTQLGKRQSNAVLDELRAARAAASR